MKWITNTELIIILLGLAVCGKQVIVDSQEVLGTLDSSYFDNSSVGMKDDSAIMHFNARYMQGKATLDVNISSEDGLERSQLGDADDTEKGTISFSNSNRTSALVDITTTTYYPGTEAIDYLIHDSTTNEVKTATNCENTSLLYEEETYLDSTTSFDTETVSPTFINDDNAVADDTISTLPSHTYFNSLVSEYRKVENGSVVFHPVENAAQFPVTYYFCYESKEKWDSNEIVRINCDSNESHCCTMGLVFLIFGTNTGYWNCNTTTYTGNHSIETDHLLFNEKFQNGLFPRVLLPSDYPYNSCEQNNYRDYVMVKGAEPYNSSTFMIEDKLFQEIAYCRKSPYETHVLLCGGPTKIPDHFQAMEIVSPIFHSATLLVFLLLPGMRTMKTSILICQIASFLVEELVNLRFYAAGGKLGKVECIFSAYAIHYFGLTGSFWINVLCIDMAWTFRGVQFQRDDWWKFRIYSLYAWGIPLLIAVLTAIFGFTTFGTGSPWKPELNSNCGFAHFPAMIIFHYGPELAPTFINWPLMTFVIYKISRGLCASAALENNDSGRHTGSKATKKENRRFIVYTNLAILIGTPRVLDFVYLATFSKHLLLITNIMSVLRSVVFFLFLCCRRKVLILLKERISICTTLITNFRKRQE